MKKRSTSAWLLLGSFVSLGLGQSSGAPPRATSSDRPQGARAAGVVTAGTAAGWTMSDDDRIARRTRSVQTSSRALGSTTISGYSESIDGLQSPELFLPHEVFDHLLWGLSNDKKRATEVRDKFDSKIIVFGYDKNKFWRTLAASAQPYLTTQRSHIARHNNSTVFQTPDGKRTFVPINRDVCAARIVALEEARRRLGSKDFDRFLYTVVAPEMSHSESGNAPDRAGQLRYMAGGCK
ncbi:MAG TPA: hypothetical protein VN380_08525 [Thermoanaerobaculia bacterium]|jgi:hypothetical protein|nr:hypothetical protein [Thermoanaerobaculia bacterium]